MAPPPENDWRTTLIQEFDRCVASLNQQIAGTNVTDPAWGRLHDQRRQYWDAISALRGDEIDGLLAPVANVTSELSDAADTAKEAAAKIQTIANTVGLTAALLVLATAIATAAATGNPGDIIPAAQGVRTASKTIIQQSG